MYHQEDNQFGIIPILILDFIRKFADVKYFKKVNLIEKYKEVISK